MSDRKKNPSPPGHRTKYSKESNLRTKRFCFFPQPIPPLDSSVSVVRQHPCYPGSISVIIGFFPTTSNVLSVFSKKFFRKFFLFVFAFPAVTATAKFLFIFLFCIAVLVFSMNQLQPPLSFLSSHQFSLQCSQVKVHSGLHSSCSFI